MSIIKKRFVTVLLLLCMTIVLPVNVYADDSSDTEMNSTSKQWNIMLVIDGSGSLFSGTKTDPYGWRYEAINAFLAAVQGKGNNIGAIVFSGNMGESTSNSDMETGILLSTDFVAVDSDDERRLMMEDIESQLDHNSRGTTDIGTALLYAQRKLNTVDNGLDSAIFLFTDGVTDMNSEATLQKSQENRGLAAKEIYDSGTLFCGVFLNKDGRIQSTEVKDVVCEANGISGGLALGNSYVEIFDARDCIASTDKFLQLLGYSFGNGGDIITETTTKSFRIPGVGVEQALIRLRSNSTLPEDLNVVITQPNGTPLSDQVVSANCTAEDSFRIYRLDAPMSGTWKVLVEIPSGRKVEIYYDPIFSTSVGVNLELTPSAEMLRMNGNVKLSAYLTQNGNNLKNPEAYSEYQCFLTLANENDEAHEVEIYPNTNNMFSGNLTFEPQTTPYGLYDMQVAFVCDSIAIKSEIQTVSLQNHAPTAKNRATAYAKYGLFVGDEAEFDVTEWVTDDEDGKNIFVSQASHFGDDAVKISGTTLTIRGKSFEGEGVDFVVTDRDGASTAMTVKVVPINMTLVLLVIILVALLVAGVAALAIKRKRDSIQLGGECKVSVPLSNKTISISITPPGTAGSRKDTLYNFLQREIKKSDFSLMQALNDADIDMETLTEFVKENRADLTHITLAVAVEKKRVHSNDKKPQLVAVLEVVYRNKTAHLYNNTKAIDIDREYVEISYYVDDVEEFDSYDDYAYEDDFDDQYNDF